MLLTPGSRIGPYEIVAPLGSGGMGEVWRARDTRLGRDVAIKTLPAAFTHHPERRARFETEAKAIAALSHPNVLAIHDLGIEGEIVYAVMELVEGQTLRELLLEGALSASRALPLAIQVANGLAAAHDRGVVHRDLKPENIIVTPEGRAKILDFGLAKLEGATESGSHSMAPTQFVSTEPGVVLGTVGYMAPEQVRGQVADARADLFSLGAVLYEMLSGRRAFHAESPADTMSAILREEPPALGSLGIEVAPALERTVQRCLEKLPANRFRSASDLAFALETQSVPGSSGAHAGAPDNGAGEHTWPAFRRLTFRNGHVAGARFTPDGAGVVYGAAWDGRAHEVFTSRIGSPESRGLGLPPGNLLSISAGGEMAVSLGHRHTLWYEASGTLARVALAGGGVRQVQKDVVHADWSPDGRTMAVIRYRDGRCVLEYPAGKSVCEAEEWLSNCRVSPDGKRVAFARHTRSGEGEADLCVVDDSGECRVLVRGATNLNGVAWSPSGDEVWWSGISAAQENGIWSAGLDGRARTVYVSPVRLSLKDVRPDGVVLLSIDDLRAGMNVGSAGGGREQDFSWFDGSAVMDLSPDGSQGVFIEVAEAENPHYASYLRNFDDSSAVRLGSGAAVRFSPDGQWVVAILFHPAHELLLYPTGFGETRSIPFEGIDRIVWAAFHPDGEHLFVAGSTAEQSQRLYRLPLAGGRAELLLDEALDFDRFVGLPISPDGTRIVLRRDGAHVIHSLVTHTSEPLRGLSPGHVPLRFDDSGRSLFVADRSAGGRAIARLDLTSAETTPWLLIEPPHPLGVLYVSVPIVAANGSRFAYSYLRVVSNLYLVEGL